MSSRSLWIEVSPRAKADFEDIIEQSLLNWGEDQAIEYHATIYRGFGELASFPKLGRSQDRLFQGCRSHPVGQHVIYYVVRTDSILIVRILHQKMNPMDRVTAPENGKPGQHE